MIKAVNRDIIEDLSYYYANIFRDDISCGEIYSLTD